MMASQISVIGTKFLQQPALDYTELAQSSDSRAITYIDARRVEYHEHRADSTIKPEPRQSEIIRLREREHEWSGWYAESVRAHESTRQEKRTFQRAYYAEISSHNATKQSNEKLKIEKSTLEQRIMTLETQKKELEQKLATSDAGWRGWYDHAMKLQS